MLTYTKPTRCYFREAGSEEWLPAQVPGSVHTDLMSLGRIPDPFVADNELHVQWVAERDWEYRVLFQLTPELAAQERIFLVCDGLDTLADVYFNGSFLGRAENMFRQYRWDVTELLTRGEEELRVLFHSPVAYIREKQAAEPLVSPSHSIPGGPYLRKAPCQFGWDWGPKLPTIGIWKEVRLEGYSTARLTDVHLRQHHHSDGSVTISARASAEQWQGDDLEVRLRVTAPDGTSWEAAALLSAQAEVQLRDPQLWWPNGYGPQPLYDVAVTLNAGERLCDRRTFKLGLRSLELRQEPDEFGTSFTFIVNGVPIFAKGADWIPADSFPTRISDEHLEHLIRSAAEVHMNMLRVWGGGFYEEERFYDLCDRYGILVWQDFIFSCSIYPDDEAFFENVRAEAVENIRRLRHRASLALWCGNNEMEWGWHAWGWDGTGRREELKKAYDRMFHHLLPELCAAEDPDHPYWPSSPSSNNPRTDPNSVRAGDTHNWEVWHGNRPFWAYREHRSRFVSEFGFQSLPALETVRTYAEEQDWNMTSYIMEHHQRNEAGNSKIITYMTDHFRMPRDFETLVYLTQLLQAECVRTGVEFWRRNRRCTSGTLYWQLNDCWPVASWSSLDYFGRWKALHYAARRFYAPVLLVAEDWWPGFDKPAETAVAEDEPRRIRWSMETLDGQELGSGELTMSTGMIMRLLGIGQQQPTGEWKPVVSLYLVNDLTTEWQGTVRWSLETVEGERLRSGDKEITAPPLSALPVEALDFSGQVTRENRRHVVLVYELWRAETLISTGVLPFAPTKHLELPDPELQYTIAEKPHEFEVELRTEKLARFVWLTLEGADVVFSDNYFDLPAGRSARVTFPKPAGWSVEDARRALLVRSLVDSF